MLTEFFLYTLMNLQECFCNPFVYGKVIEPITAVILACLRNCLYLVLHSM